MEEKKGKINKISKKMTVPDQFCITGNKHFISTELSGVKALLYT